MPSKENLSSCLTKSAGKDSNSKSSACDETPIKTNSSGTLLEGNGLDGNKLENAAANSTKAALTVTASKAKEKLEENKIVEQKANASPLTHGMLDSPVAAKTGKEIASQTHTNGTKTLQTQTVKELATADQRTECASQTTVTSADVETRADSPQAGAAPREERRPHSTTLVVTARKSSVRSLAADGGSGDPCAPCQSTLSGGFVPGSDTHSEGPSFTTVCSLIPQQPSSPTPRSQPSVCASRGVTAAPPPRRPRAEPPADSSDDSFVSAPAAGRRGLDELSVASRCSGADSGGFLSASSSSESLRSALASPGTAARPRRPPLGIPMSGGGGRAERDARSDRAAERQRRRCARALDQLGMSPRLPSSSSRRADVEVVLAADSDAAGSSGSGGGGRPVAEGGVFRSATSVSEVAPHSGQSGKQGADTGYGRWRRTAGRERQRRAGDTASEPESDRDASSRSRHSVQSQSSPGA